MPKRSVRRSGLTMPVNNPRFLNAVWTRGCDFVNLDLEDSVPESQKPHARTLIQSAIPTAAKGGAEVFVRINHDYVEADLEGVVWPGLARVNYPKAETAEEMRKLDHHHSPGTRAWYPSRHGGNRCQHRDRARRGQRAGDCLRQPTDQRFRRWRRLRHVA